jgi:hypothetical protein
MQRSLISDSHAKKSKTKAFGPSEVVVSIQSLNMENGGPEIRQIFTVDREFIGEFLISVGNFSCDHLTLEA